MEDADLPYRPLSRERDRAEYLLVFRFANSLFESLWNNRYIDHVQITVAEEIGIGTSGAFWEEAGLLRDIVQNHMMQLLSLVAMEPPVNLSANAIRDEKVKVLEALRPFTEAGLQNFCHPGTIWAWLYQWRAGARLSGRANVNPNIQCRDLCRHASVISIIGDGMESPSIFAAANAFPNEPTEIAIISKIPLAVLFQQNRNNNEPNVLAIRIQPDEGTSLKINCKVPGPASPDSTGENGLPLWLLFWNIPSRGL